MATQGPSVFRNFIECLDNVRELVLIRWDLILKLDIGAHACNPSTWGPESRRLLQVQGKTLTRPNKQKLNIKIPFLKSCDFPKEKNFLDTTSLGLDWCDWFVQQLQSGGIFLEFRPNLKIIGTCII